MTRQELDEAKADLAAAKASLRRRIGGKELQAVGSTGETVTYAKATVAELREIIRELEVSIRWGDPSALGALHIR